MKHYTLLEIERSIESVISRTYNKSYWVKAEISKLNFYPKSGHCYPELVEKQNGKIVAQMRSTIWKSTFIDITTSFRKQTGENLSEGMEVLFRVQVVYKPNYGMSLNVLDIDPSFTLGKLAKERAETIERLKKEGLFDRNRQLSFPYLPLRYAVISVETSKGYHDLIKIIEEKLWFYNTHIELFPALLQGDKAVDSIIEQLTVIEGRKEEFDLVLIIRGGGGEIGLHAYNNYRLSKAVALFPLPVITGIGHATNDPVTCLVANRDKITPTEVANFLVEQINVRAVNLIELIKKLRSQSPEFIDQQKSVLENMTNHLQNLSNSLIRHHQNLLALLSKDLDNRTERLLRNASTKLHSIPITLHHSVKWQIGNNHRNIDRLATALETATGKFLESEKQNIALKQTKVTLLSPENVLKRGYSITTINGKAVHSVNDVQKGDHIITVIKDGKIYSKIENTEQNEEN